jgi:hypothetical protein
MAKKQRALKTDPWNDRYLIQYIIDRKKEAKDASKDRRKAWRELWLLYQNRQDYSKKQNWQAKCFVPKLWMKVEKGSATVKRGIIQTNKLFKLMLDETMELEGDQRQMVREEGVRRERRFKRELDKTNFANIYSEMIKSGILLGLGIPKVLWKDGKATYENIDTLNVFIDPTYKPNQPEPPGFLIETKEIELSELRRMAKDTTVFDMNEINKIEEDFKKVELEQRMRERQGLSQYVKGVKKVQIDEFWGDVISKDGKEVKKRQLMMLANEKYLIRKQDNPFNHKRPPYILTYMLIYPHRGIAGQSLVEPAAKLQYMYNNILNLYMDNMNFSVNKVFEYNPLSLSNPKSLTSIYPGKLVATNTPESVVKEVYTSKVGTESIAALETIGREIQEGTAVTEFIEGMPSRKSKTLGEVEIKTAESHGMFDIIIRDLEQNSIKPLLEMTYSLYEQFSDFEPIEDMFIIRVGGLSLLVMERQQKQRIGQVLMFALESEELKTRTDIDDLWRKYLSIDNLSDVYIEPEAREQPQMTPEQEDEIVQKAEEDARKEVAAMSPEQIEQY